MKRTYLLFSLALLILAACSQQNALSTGPNVLAAAAGSCGGASGYPNQTCVSVTICSPGTSSCQTISNVLLDTGSYGLRVFSSVIGVSLTTEADSSGNVIAECTPFAGGNSEWGPVKIADVSLSGNRASSIPIQVVDSTFPGIPTDCTNPDVNPASAGFNGILGIGPLVEDCGATCASLANNRVYFACAGSSCRGTTLPIQSQVANPAAFLTSNNNGIVVQFSSVPTEGATQVAGAVVLGIGTASNNIPSGVTVFPADSNGYFTTVFNGQSFSTSFIDSGSNGYFFPSSITQCANSGDSAGLYCPTSLTSLVATLTGANQSGQKQASFQIMNGQTILSSSNHVFSNLGGTAQGAFDWGFPFFLGRSIYIGFDGKNSTLGKGPFFAY